MNIVYQDIIGKMLPVIVATVVIPSILFLLGIFLKKYNTIKIFSGEKATFLQMNRITFFIVVILYYSFGIYFGYSIFDKMLKLISIDKIFTVFGIYIVVYAVIELFLISKFETNRKGILDGQKRMDKYFMHNFLALMSIYLILILGIINGIISKEVILSTEQICITYGKADGLIKTNSPILYKKFSELKQEDNSFFSDFFIEIDKIIIKDNKKTQDGNVNFTVLEFLNIIKISFFLIIGVFVVFSIVIFFQCISICSLVYKISQLQYLERKKYIVKNELNDLIYKDEKKNILECQYVYEDEKEVYVINGDKIIKLKKEYIVGEIYTKQNKEKNEYEDFLYRIEKIKKDKSIFESFMEVFNFIEKIRIKILKYELLSIVKKDIKKDKYSKDLFLELISNKELNEEEFVNKLFNSSVSKEEKNKLKEKLIDLKK